MTGAHVPDARSQAERWQRARTVFDAVLSVPAVERMAFLEQACADSGELRADVEELLRADAEANPLFDVSVAGLAGELLSAKPQAGSEIGPYTVVRELGRGGMATVYLAQD